MRLALVGQEPQGVEVAGPQQPDGAAVERGELRLVQPLGLQIVTVR